jgi:hypothetical protein
MSGAESPSIDRVDESLAKDWICDGFCGGLTAVTQSRPIPTKRMNLRACHGGFIGHWMAFPKNG